jgi:large subunit ribosomal protein L28
MSRICDICKKGPMNGNHRSHAMNATKRKYYPNLQKIRAEINGIIKGIKLCTSCLKKNKVKKVI